MDLGLKGKVALVAAGSRGLGRAVAEEFAAEGAQLALCARGSDELHAVAESIASASGVTVFAEPVDVSAAADVERFVTRAIERLGRIDVLVTNSGGPPSGPFESTTPVMWDDAVRLLLGSTLAFARAVLPGMKQRRWGRIITVTSLAVKQPIDGLILSNSIRAAVTGFARTLANEVGPFNITVNNAMPGYTRTERLDVLAKESEARGGPSADSIRQGWAKQIPLGRIAEPREFAALVAFLASERASYITAQSIAVDGGWIRSLL